MERKKRKAPEAVVRAAVERYWALVEEGRRREAWKLELDFYSKYEGGGFGDG